MLHMDTEVQGGGCKCLTMHCWKVAKSIFLSRAVQQPNPCDLWSGLDTLPQPLPLALVNILLEWPTRSLPSHWHACLWCSQFKNCNTYTNNSSKQVDIAEWVRAKITLPFSTSLENHHHFLEILSELHVVHGTLDLLAFCRLCHSKEKEIHSGIAAKSA